jgi:hypothetical protein
VACAFVHGLRTGPAVRVRSDSWRKPKRKGAIRPEGCKRSYYETIRACAISTSPRQGTGSMPGTW